MEADFSFLPESSIVLACNACGVPVPNQHTDTHLDWHARQARATEKLQQQLDALTASRDALPGAGRPSALVLDDDEVGFGPVGCGRAVQVELSGRRTDVLAALALLDAKHIHLDHRTGPVPHDESQVSVYASLDLEEWFRLAVQRPVHVAANPPAEGGTEAGDG
ncbi:hypothetical protein [Planotetraspora sp. GP83]|uniref:hypothetical protein n=1 Tax=Planotetraspora sp. GP83 TaxID=3156264 RepID=UPI0035150309